MRDAKNNWHASSEQIALKQIKKQAEQFWAASKYDVMARGYASYKQISARYRDASTAADYEAAMHSISHTLDALPYTMKGLRTSIEHMWGYVSKYVHEEERTMFQQLFDSLEWKPDANDLDTFEATTPLLLLIQEFAVKYDVTYIEKTMANSFPRLAESCQLNQIQDH
ncbi:YbgA family protein [Paenibacillus sp. SC116]|uniref:YbgA family protein n=1 Tax=Paenibacillus sp. SC116 TaxID=2968986 RepID=UPI00215A78D5|nr:YbgA family protein [Paenibacillus sp. SC116]MCR8844685.1 YbgA family protein [Paenibacillus sp. SC116]